MSVCSSTCLCLAVFQEQKQQCLFYQMHSFALDAAVKLEYFDLLPRAEAASADPRVFVMTLFIRLPRHRHHWLINIFSHLSLYLCVCLLPLSLPLYFILSVNHSPLWFCPFFCPPLHPDPNSLVSGNSLSVCSGVLSFSYFQFLIY